MFYQVWEEGQVIGKHNARREAFKAAAQDLNHRRVCSVKYEGTVLKTIHEFSRDEVEDAIRKLQLRAV